MSATRKTTIPRRKPTPQPTRVPVLIVCHPDGFLEVFAEQNLQVHTATALDVLPCAEALASDYLHETLPAKFRELHFANKLRATANITRRSAIAERDRRHDLEILRAIRDLKGNKT